MKKLDKLILKSFIGPFLVTFLVAVFILLLVYMMKYFDDFIGKNLGFIVFAKLMGYFSINQVPMALPLAVLISSLMTYGKLGEHFELTAIKGAGISLLRVILPTFVFCLILAFGAFLLSNYVVPVANLKAYSLLYDIKQTKPSMDLREGQFYSGIPKYSIKIEQKYPDGMTMKNIIIYDHTDNNGNKRVIIADSCRMYSFMGDRYLKMDLYRGNHYIEEEQSGKGRKSKESVSQFVRTHFTNMELVFSLASFDLGSTDENLFADNRYMKGIAALTNSIDSMNRVVYDTRYKIYGAVTGAYQLHLGGYIEPPSGLIQKKLEIDSIQAAKERLLTDTLETVVEGQNMVEKAVTGTQKVRPRMDTVIQRKPEPKPDPNTFARNIDLRSAGLTTSLVDTDQLERKREKKMKADSMYVANDSLLTLVKYKMDSVYRKLGIRDQVLARAVGSARTIKSTLNSNVLRMKSLKVLIDSHVVEKHKKYAQAFSCIVMFLIGAPLGAIIKRGGLGLPVIISIFFFIIFYIFTSVGDKWAKSGVVDGFYAAWMANFVLLPVGILFLKQARKDAKIFDADFYNVWIDNAKTWWASRKINKSAQA